MFERPQRNSQSPRKHNLTSKATKSGKLKMNFINLREVFSENNITFYSTQKMEKLLQNEIKFCIKKLN